MSYPLTYSESLSENNYNIFELSTLKLPSFRTKSIYFLNREIMTIAIRDTNQEFLYENITIPLPLLFSNVNKVFTLELSPYNKSYKDILQMEIRCFHKLRLFSTLKYFNVALPEELLKIVHPEKLLLKYDYNSHI